MKSMKKTEYYMQGTIWFIITKWEWTPGGKEFFDRLFKEQYENTQGDG